MQSANSTTNNQLWTNSLGSTKFVQKIFKLYAFDNFWILDLCSVNSVLIGEIFNIYTLQLE